MGQAADTVKKTSDEKGDDSEGEDDFILRGDVGGSHRGSGKKIE